jgi:hypothetical protein
MLDNMQKNIRMLLLLFLAFCLVFTYKLPVLAADNPIPWGAMYTPNEHLTSYGMRGTVKYYRGNRGAQQLLKDLNIAYKNRSFLIITLGTTNPQLYLTEKGHINFKVVYKELQPFFLIAQEIQPFIDNKTIWGIRFMDEPHNPRGMPRGFKIKETELGEVFKMIKKYFKHVKVGSTAPAAYMVNVPNADFAFGQYNHSNSPHLSLTDFFEKETKLALSCGLKYVASLNSNMNAIDNYTFFQEYSKLCEIKGVDFITSWQWPQGRYPYPSFEKRLKDPSVKKLIEQIPLLCGWE